MKFKPLIFSAVFVLAVFAFAGVANATDNSAQIAQIQAQINALMQQVAQMQGQGGSSSWCHTFNSNLGYNQSGSSEVAYLHTALTLQGFSYSPDTGNTYYTGTATAVSGFQERYASQVLSPSGLTKGTGFFGAATRTKMNALYGCTTTNTNTNTSTYYTLSYSAAAGGYISGTATQTVISGGSGNTVTAIANSGYTFSNWSDGNTSATRTDNYVYANKYLTANFTQTSNTATNTYTLTYIAGTGGYISGSTTQNLSYGSTGNSVTAIANSGYTFSNWSDGSTSVTRTDIAYYSRTITANFTTSTTNTSSPTITYIAGNGGYISGNPNQTVPYGGSGTMVTAVPYSGYTFSGWSDGITNASRTESPLYSNKTLTASFTQGSSTSNYTITYTAGTGGYISGSTTQNLSYGSTSTSVTAVANSGYTFSNWSDGSTSATRTDIAYYTRTLTANFTQTSNTSTNTYTLAYVAGTGGSISGNASQNLSFGSTGTSVTAVANSGYTFSSWSDGSTNPTRTDVVYYSQTITANFTQSSTNTYTITYTAGTGGTISGTATQSLSYGATSTSVTATANSGYTFSNWSDGSTNPTRTDIAYYSRTITANFTQSSANTYTITYTVGTGGYISGATSQSLAYGATGTSVTAIANSGYTFSNWSDGSTNPTRTDIAYYTRTLTANFTQNSVVTTYYTLTYTAGTGGYISGVLSQSIASGNSGTAVTAMANSGYTFSSWSDGSTSATRTDENITANRSVTANFTRNTYTLTYAAGTGGYISGTVSQTVNAGESGTAVVATPNSGYYFTSWSDGNTSASRTDNSVYSNLSVTASFSPNLALESPAASSSLTIGQASLISWKANSNVVSNVIISIYNVTSGSTYQVVTVPAVSNTSTGQGYYYWLTGTTPTCTLMPAGTQYKVVITSASDPTLTVSSGFITLVAPNRTGSSGGSASISLVSPLGGDSWKIGTSHWIIWNTSGLLASDRISFKPIKDSTTPSTMIGTTTNETGLYCWTIPSGTYAPGQWKMFVSTGANASAIATYTSPWFNITQ